MWSIGIWKPIDRKFVLRPWLRNSITTRCGSMLSLGMRLPMSRPETHPRGMTVNSHPQAFSLKV